MSKDQNWKDMGEQILDSVAGALSTGDFSHLNDLVNDAVNSVVNEAKRQSDASRINGRESMERYEKSRAEMQERWKKQQEELLQREKQRREQWQQSRADRLREQMEQDAGRRHQEKYQQPVQAGSQKVHRNKNSDVPFQSIGSVSNVLYTVFGGIGLGVGVCFGIVALIMIALGHGLFNFWTLLTIGLIIPFVMMLGKGAKERETLRRAKRYIQICGEKKYASLADLAAATDKSVRYVKKDLRKMMKKGMFPQGHIDAQETCFILNDEVYRQYTETAKAFQMRQQMEQEEKERRNHPLSPKEQEELERRQRENELNVMIAKGNEAIRKLQELNSLLPGEEITGRLDRLDSLLQQIFNRIKEEPEQMYRMEKLMDYYLPTTVKLVEAYVDFEKVENPGQDIRDAKWEILKTLGIINEAFEELLNNLFQDAAFDAATDAQVLQTMLAREGLRRELSAEEQTKAPSEPSSVPDLELSPGEQIPFPVCQPQEQVVFPTSQPQPEANVLKAPWES